MKKIERALVAIALVALVLKGGSLPGASLLLTLSCLALASLYFYLGFALFNDISLQKLFKKTAYQGITGMRILGSIAVGAVLSIIVIGLLFKVTSLPGANANLTVGLIGTSAIVIISWVNYIRTNNGYHRAKGRYLRSFGVARLAYEPTYH